MIRTCNFVIQLAVLHQAMQICIKLYRIASSYAVLHQGLQCCIRACSVVSEQIGELRQFGEF